MLRCISKHFISHLKVFIHLGGKLLPWRLLNRLSGKGKCDGSSSQHEAAVLDPNPVGMADSVQSPGRPEIDGLAPLHVHCRRSGNMNWVPTVLGAGDTEADKQTGNQKHRPDRHPLQGSAEGSGSGGRELDENRATKPSPAAKRPGQLHHAHP